jgi:hypothetical protein
MEHMNDPGSSRLALRRFLERVQGPTWHAPAAGSPTKNAARPNGGEVSKPGCHAFEWLIERGLNRESEPVSVHAGDCWSAVKRSRGASWRARSDLGRTRDDAP